MRIVLVGAPNTSKTELANAILKLYPGLETISGSAELYVLSNAAVGYLADYRTELMLATTRADDMASFKNGIFVGSVLDNVAYEYTRYEDLKRSGILDEAQEVRHYLTSAILYAILIDSMRADVIAFLPLAVDQNIDSYSALLDAFYPQLLEHFGADYVTLEGTFEDKLEGLREAVENTNVKEDDGQGTSVTEPSEEESERSR